MKKIISIMVFMLSIVLIGCEDLVVVDYNEVEFEEALTNGADVEGVTVEFIVYDIVPDTPFGHSLQTENGLSFVSPIDPGHKIGDKVIVEVENVGILFGSYFIGYK